MNKSFSLFVEQLKKLNLPKGKYAIFGSGPICDGHVKFSPSTICRQLKL